MDAKQKSIWIDLDNAPHVPLFAPIIKHYRDRDIEVIVTARDHSQTIELLRQKGFDGTFEVIGRHYGKSKLAKIRGLIARARQLSSHIKELRRKGVNLGVAISHGSRSMVLAAKWLKIPVLTMYDYEFTETGIFNRFSDRVLVPDAIPDEVLDSIGLRLDKRVKYPGIKEELYIKGYRPGQDLRREIFPGNDLTDRVFVLLRPPATTANYHSEKSEFLLSDILRRLVTTENVFTVVVPRTAEQGEKIHSIVAEINPWSGCLILGKAVNGLDLAYAADLVISGGGTMNREAALLGVPVYSFFAGRQGSLDTQMEKEGLIKFIRNPKDVAGIKLQKRPRDGKVEHSNGLTDRVERFVIEQINTFLEKG